jgi:hypothetical protein
MVQVPSKCNHPFFNDAPHVVTNMVGAWQVAPPPRHHLAAPPPRVPLPPPPLPQPRQLTLLDCASLNIIMTHSSVIVLCH